MRDYVISGTSGQSVGSGSSITVPTLLVVTGHRRYWQGASAPGAQTTRQIMAEAPQNERRSALTAETSAAAEDAEKLAALRRVKLFATGALAICIALFAAARLLEPRFPIFGFVAAFAGAA